MRCFLGLPLPDEARDALRGACAALRMRASGRNARWVPWENLHLTVRFLGESDPRQIRAVTDEVSAVCQSVEAPELQIGEPGVFPGRGSRPLVFWAGVRGDTRALDELAAAVERAARAAGFPAERRAFRAHVTLARLKGEAATALQADLLPTFAPADCTPTALCLYESRLRPEGPPPVIFAITS